MRFVRNMLITTITFVGTGYMAYRLVLNNGARKEVRKAAETLWNSYQRINEVIEDITGIIVDEEDDPLPNRSETMRQWEALGYEQ